MSPDRHLAVAILAPTEADGQISKEILEKAGFKALLCHSVDQLCECVNHGIGAILLTDAVLVELTLRQLGACLNAQPAWSDLPVLLLAGEGLGSPVVEAGMHQLGNATILERPVRISTLISAVRSAVNARARQYELRDRLEALRESEEQLRVAIADIQENDRKKDEFLATLAHELRNPLAPIMNAIRILELNPEATTRDDLLRMLNRQARQMVRLIDDLLDMSRITRGKLELRKRPVELSSILDQAIETVRPHLDAARHEFTVCISDEPIRVDADPIRLAQVFSNLLNNAAKYTQEGGRIRLSVARHGRLVEVVVSDNGIGIPPDKLSDIFEIFTQVPRENAGPLGGLGIGLTLVLRLVTMHGGTVVAESDGLDRGSRFTVRLPLLNESGPISGDSSSESAGAVLL